MYRPATIDPQIVESLYAEALALSNEVRATFVLGAGANEPGSGCEAARLALSCEALRTTTRMMHALAWLLNHRAYFAGELSEFQMRRHGRLVDFPAPDRHRMALIAEPTRALIDATERFYARLTRLDEGWSLREIGAPGAIARLRERLGVAAST